MSLIPGETLRHAWPSFTNRDKEHVTTQLGEIVDALRQLHQGPSGSWIGSVNGGAVQDRYFKPDYKNGPFHSIKSFNDWVFAAATRQRPDPEGVDYGSYAEFCLVLPDEGNIAFTHGDLGLGNILVQGAPGSFHVVGVIDWEHAGWYPEFWEYFKFLCAVETSHEWRSQRWTDEVMKSYARESEILAQYFNWRCP